MKHLIFILALLWCASALAQPVNRIKLRQLQAAPDTTSNYRIISSKDTSRWALVGVNEITNVPDTSSLTPTIGDIFVNAAKDTLGIYGTSWVLFFGGSPGDNLGDHTATQSLNMDGNTILGGTGTTSDLVLQTTSGVGATGADMFFLVGNNGGTEAMKILNNGNVGIGGATTPAQTLHVQGTARITGSDGTPTGIMGRDADGDVGAVSLGTGLTLTTGTLAANDTVTTLIQDSILVYSFAGVETGRDTLQLSLGGGGGSSTNLATANQTATGDRAHNWGNYDLLFNSVDSFQLAVAQRLNITQNAGKFLHQTGGGDGAGVFENLFFGYLAGGNVTPGTSYANTVIGRRAGYSLNLSGGAPTASSNSILGYGAGESLTTGTGNTILGTAAGGALTSASGNVIIGWHSALNATGGDHNIMLGFDAGKINTTDENVYIGKFAGSANSTGNQNTFLGAFTGTFGADVSRTVLLGHGAGEFITGDENIIIGVDAGNSASNTGTGNILIGDEAGKAITTGANNIIIGRDAGTVFQTSSSNTIVGWSAFLGNATGNQNSVLGANALRSNTTGYNNMAIGYEAMRLNTTGRDNASMGVAALYNNTTGVRNMAVGSSALLSNNTGNDNVAIGQAAGLYITGASSQNTFLGGVAGAFLDGGGNLTSANNSTYVGYGTDASAAGVTNETVIGYDAKGAGSNTVTLGNTSVTTTILRANTGIGETSPTAVLHLKAGTATASTAPLKINEGTNLTTPEDGAIEHTSDNLNFTAGSTRYTLAKTLTATSALDFASTSAQSSTDLTITVTGAADGDAVHIGVPNGSVNANTCFTGWVSAADTVTIRFNNYSSGAVDPASGTFRAVVTKY